MMALRTMVGYLLVLFFSASTLAEVQKVSVTSPHWEVVGERINILGKEVDQFLGIPYGEPPIGDLRFKKPLPLKEFPKKLEALVQLPSCHQVQYFTKVLKLNRLISDEGENENCLHLNIWKPADINQVSEMKAVIIWVFGGAFIVGSTGYPFYKGQALSALGDVVLVSINYRLGSFGMFTAGTAEESGNLLLYDQQLAFKWVQDNIHHFGGDPSRVTIFGESAGGIAVAAHLTSAFSAGLFHRAIIQSGTTLIHTTISDKKDVMRKSENIARNSGCLGDDESFETHSEQVLKCMRSKSPQDILEAEMEMMNSYDVYNQLSIIYDEEFLGYDSKYPFIFSTLNDAQIIIGFTKDESGSTYKRLFREMREENPPKITKKQAYKMLGRYFEPIPNEKLLVNILDSYFEEVDESNLTAIDMTVSQVMTDYDFKCPAVYFVENDLFRKNDIYFYQYTHQNNRRYNQRDWDGAFHFDDVPYIFGAPMTIPAMAYTDEEKDFSRNLIELWTSFAKTGHPQSPRHYHWPLYSPDSPQVLDLHAASAKVYLLPQYSICHRTWRPVFSPDAYCEKDNCP